MTGRGQGGASVCFPVIPRPQAVRLLGVSDRTFDRLQTEGVLVPVTPRRGSTSATYDAPSIVAAYLAHREARAGALDLNAERAALAKSQREKVDLDVAVRRAELVPREEMVAEWSGYILRTRARLLSVAAIARSRGVAPAAVAMFEALVRAALDDLAADREDAA